MTPPPIPPFRRGRDSDRSRAVREGGGTPGRDTPAGPAAPGQDAGTAPGAAAGTSPAADAGATPAAGDATPAADAGAT
ncbi:MAG: hypothetical protein ACTHXO_05515, partial [Actinomycetaceae bacterium]